MHESDLHIPCPVIRANAPYPLPGIDRPAVYAAAPGASVVYRSQFRDLANAGLASDAVVAVHHARITWRYRERQPEKS